jgi:copper chaperone CopZ
MNNYVFKINGMYCAACEIWLEDAIKQIMGVEKVSASLHGNTVKVSSSLEESVLRSEISKVLLNNGGKYSLGEKVETNSSNKSSFFYPVLIALVVISRIN